MYKIKHISPMIPSYDLKETSSFFKDVLNFTIVLESPGYVILEKDGSKVHLLNAGDDIGEMEFYMEVENTDEFWKTVKDKLKGSKYREPYDREYGMREVHIIIPQTKTLLFAGSVIKK